MAITIKRLDAILREFAQLPEPDQSIRIADAIRKLAANPKDKSRAFAEIAMISETDRVFAEVFPDLNAEQRAEKVAEVTNLLGSADAASQARTESPRVH